jgi:hypothetical protein
LLVTSEGLRIILESTFTNSGTVEIAELSIPV